MHFIIAATDNFEYNNRDQIDQKRWKVIICADFNIQKINSLNDSKYIFRYRFTGVTMDTRKQQCQQKIEHVSVMIIILLLLLPFHIFSKFFFYQRRLISLLKQILPNKVKYRNHKHSQENPSQIILLDIVIKYNFNKQIVLAKLFSVLSEY